MSLNNCFFRCLIALLLSYITSSQQQASPCYRKNLISNLCHDCFNSFFNPENLSLDFPSSECQTRISPSDLPLKEIFVKNTSCEATNPCNGLQSTPMDSLGKALYEAHHFSNKFSSSAVTIYLLGNEHYILRSSLLLGEGFPLLKRVNMTLKITTWLCSQMALQGCFDSEAKRASIILKTDGLNLFVANELKVSRINFRANDLFLINDTNQNSASDCGNQKRICCQAESFYLSPSKNPCGLLYKSIPFSSENMWKSKYGLINLETIYDDPSATLKSPALSIENCTFSEIYPARDGVSYIALIVVGNPGAGVIELRNVSFSNMRLLKGAFWLADEDSLYPRNTYFTSFDVETKNYSNTRAILFSNVSLELFDNFSIYRVPAENENSMINLRNFEGKILFNKVLLSKTESSEFWYTFISIYNCSWVEFSSLQMEKIRNLFLMTSIYSNIMITNMTIVNTSAPSLFRLNNTNITISVANLLNVTADFNASNRFLIIDSGNFFISNVLINGSNNISFFIANCQKADIRDSLFKNLNIANKTLFFIDTTPLIFQNIEIINITEISLNYIVQFINSKIDNINIEVKNIHVSGYQMKSNSSTIFYLQNYFLGGSFYLDNLIAENSYAGNVILSDTVSFLRILNVKVLDFYFKYSSPTYYLIRNFLQASCEGLLISNVKNNYYLVYFTDCKNCSVTLIEMSVYGLEVASTKPFFFASTNVTLKNIKFYNPVTYTLTASNLIFVSATNSVLLNVFFSVPAYPCLTLIKTTGLNGIISNVVSIGDPSYLLPCKLVASDEFSENYSISNVTIINMTGYMERPYIEERNGIIIFYGADSDYTRSITIFKSIYISNVSFLDCGSSYYGLIGIVNVLDVVINNITSATQTRGQSNFIRGGVLSIRYASTATINNIYVSNLTSKIAAGVYLSDILFVSLKNINCFNLSATESAGSIYVKSVNQFEASSLVVDTSFSIIKGGVITVEGSKNITFSNIKCLNASIPQGDGAVIYLIGGNLTITNANIRSTTALRGGFIYVLNGTSLDINSVNFDASFVTLSGLFVSIEEIIFFSIKNVIITNSTSQEAFGTMYIRGSSYNTCEIRNISLSNIRMEEASFLYMDSNNYLIITDSSFFNLKGNIIKSTSQTNAKMKIMNMNISNCTVFGGAALINLLSTNLIMMGFNNKIYDNSLSGSIVRAESSNIVLRNVIFYRNSHSLNSIEPTILQLTSSTSTFENITYKANPTELSSFLVQLGGTTIINNSRLENCKSLSSACLNVEFSRIELIKTFFIKSQGTIAGSLYLLTTDANIRECYFEKGLSTYKPSKDGFFLSQEYAIYSNEITALSNSLTNKIKITLIQNEFLINDNYSPVVTFNLYEEIIIESTVFSSFSQSIPGEGLLILRSNILIRNCSFEGLFSYAGAAAKFYNDVNDQPKNITIINCEFIRNSAGVGGVLILIGYIRGELVNSSFFNNSAKKSEATKWSGVAGCLYFSCLNCSEAYLSLSGNIFKENFAEYHSPTVFSQANLFEKEENQFFDNRDSINFTQRISALPLKAMVSNFIFKEAYYRESLAQQEEAANIDASNNSSRILVSGAYFDLNITYTDSFNQTIIFSNFIDTKLSKNVNSTAAIWAENLLSSPGSSVFKNVKVNTQPNSSFNLHIEIDFFEDKLLPYIMERNDENNITKILNVYIKPCSPGELYIKGVYSCELCPQGSFSLLEPLDTDSYNQKCSICPLNAYCSGGDMITPLRGFWRANSYSSLLLECPSSDSCLGNSDGFDNYTFEERVQGRCAVHHYGPLCYTCDEGFARVMKNGNCEDCTNNVALYLKTIIGLLLILGYVIIEIKYSVSQSSHNYSNILLKQLLTHFQQISVISMTDFGWTTDIKSYFFFQNYLSFFSEEIFSFDCMFLENKNILIRNVLIAVISPVCFVAVLLALSFLHNLIKSRSINIKSLYSHGKISLLLVVYILYPEILRKCFSLLDCFKIDDHSEMRVLRRGPDIECWTDYHKFYTIVLALPGFLIWGVLYPAALLIIMYRRTKAFKLSKEKVIMNTTQNAFITTENHEIPAKPEETPAYLGKSQAKSTPIITTILDKADETNLNSLSNPQKISSSETPKTDLINLNQSDAHTTKILGLTLKFVYKGYKMEYYYWELVIFLKKILIIFIGSFTELFPPESRATIMIVLINIFLLLQIRVVPYKIDRLNQIEYYSLIVVFISAIIGTMLFSQELKIVGILFMIIMIVLNSAFVIFWFYTLFYLRIKYKKLSKRK